MTKKREDKQRAELRQRIADIVSGACGRDMDTDDEWVSVEELPNIIGALRERFSDLDECRTYMTSSHCLGDYATVASLVEFFWVSGVRA